MDAVAITFHGRDVIGVDAAREPDAVQLLQNLEHVDIAIIQQRFFKGAAVASEPRTLRMCSVKMRPLRP